MIFFHRNTKMKTQYTKMNNDRVTIDCKQLLIVAAEGPVWANHPLSSCDDADGLFGSKHFKVQKWNPGEAKTCTKIPRVSSRSLWTTLKICQFLQFWSIKETAKAKLKASLQSDLIMKQEPSQKHIAAIIYNFSRGFWLNLMHINLWLFDFFWYFTSVCFTSIAMDPNSHSILTT